MPNSGHVNRLKEGVEAWNAWRDGPDGVEAPDLRGAKLDGAILNEANLAGADLREASLVEGQLTGADLARADLSGANLDRAVLAHAYLEETRMHGGTARAADFRGVQAFHLQMGSWLPTFPSATDLTGANLNRAWLVASQLGGSILVDIQARDAVFDDSDMSSIQATRADLRRASFESAWLTNADFTQAKLTGADLSKARAREAIFADAKLQLASFVDADLRAAKMPGAQLSGTDLTGADLRDARITGGDLSGSDLSYATLVGASLAGSTISGARVFGVSAWRLDLTGVTQPGLVITPVGEPIITVDDLEVAQFVFIFLDNRKIRSVIDTLTSKVVLLLGRFSPERKAVLDGLGAKLRSVGLVSVVFDFDRPESRNLTETITLLARLARFIIADLTDPRSVPLELGAIVGEVRVPLLPLIEGDQKPFGMFVDLLEDDAVLPLHRYGSIDELIAAFSSKLLPSLEERRLAVLERRARAIAMTEDAG